MEADLTKMLGIHLITAERVRQVEAEGWTPEHDDEHTDGGMALAAACYTLHAQAGMKMFERRFADWSVEMVAGYQKASPPPGWPWHAAWWKPKNPVRDLERAGALLAAEIDRIRRQTVKP